MSKDFFYIIIWTVLAAFAVALFSFLKIKASGNDCSETVYARDRENKIDSSVLPESSGENLLSGKSFAVSGDEYTFALDFYDAHNLTVTERFPVDEFFSLDLSWNASYSFDGEKNQLYIKRTALVCGEDKKTLSLDMVDFLSEKCAGRILEAMDSVSLEEGDWKNLVYDRMYSYVDRRLYEIESFGVTIEGNGILLEPHDVDSWIFASSLIFSSADFDGTASVGADCIFIRKPGEEKSRAIGGVMVESDGSFHAALYDFDREKGSRNINLVHAGEIVFKTICTDKVSDSQTCGYSMEIIRAPDFLGLVPGTVLDAQKILYPQLKWMNGADPS